MNKLTDIYHDIFQYIFSYALFAQKPILLRIELISS